MISERDASDPATHRLQAAIVTPYRKQYNPDRSATWCAAQEVASDAERPRPLLLTD